ncbi:MAG: PH domain-containing protein, partial [Stackebrandtia sp.]
LARLRWGWLVHNVFTVWAFLVAAGLVWGGNALGGFIGVDLLDWAARSLGWHGFWHWPSMVAAVAGLGLLGVAGLAVVFVTENWGFRLTRVHGPSNSTLRTQKGLFSTREVNRDEARLRGVQLDQPLLWRWMGTTGTVAISTGLSVFSEGRDLLPRTNISTAQAVAARVLPAAGPLFARRLGRHPRAALRRRVVRAVAAVGVFTGLVAYSGRVASLIPDSAWIYCVSIGLPLGLGLAVASYLSLGHAVEGDFIVTRSGVLSRATAVLRRRSVIGWTFKQSVFHRRAGLLTVTATTAAGDRAYTVLDTAEADALDFADRATPELLHPFLVDGPGS